MTVQVHHLDDVDAGQQAVRDEDVDVLVVDAEQLMWGATPMSGCAVVVTWGIQLVELQERAAAAGIDADELLALVAPVPVETWSWASLPGADPTTRRQRR